MKYIFLDIDGTLYSPTLGAIPNSAKIAIKKARENGNKVFLCTGRTKGECKIYFTPEYDGFIMGAGSQVMIDGEMIFNRSISKEKVRYFRKKIEENLLGYSISTENKTYCDPVGYYHLRKYFGLHLQGDISDAYMKEIGYYHISDYNDIDSVYKIATFSDNNKLISTLKDYILDDFINYFSYENYIDNIYMTELLPKEVNKALGVRKVIEYYKGDMDDSFCIGDTNNDLDMVKECKIGVSMGNGIQALKEVADYTTTNILEDGLYNAFKHFNII